MKKVSFYSIVACLFLMTGISSCSSDDANSSSSNPQPLINAAKSGSWKITYFFDTDSEETADFANYIFTFGDGNVLTATNGSSNHTGSWSVTDSDSNDDDSNSGSDLDFNIGFTAPARFAELSDDWDIVSYSATKIELIDVSGGNGGTDRLTFERM